MAKVTVITPSYNKNEYALEAIRSVLNQTFTDFEYWIIENSNDRITRDKIRRIAETDKRIKYIEKDFSEQERRELYITSLILNEFYPQANSEYIFYLSDDDIIYPNCLARCVEFMEKDKRMQVGYFSLAVTEEYELGKFIRITGIPAIHDMGPQLQIV